MKNNINGKIAGEKSKKSRENMRRMTKGLRKKASEERKAKLAQTGIDESIVEDLVDDVINSIGNPEVEKSKTLESDTKQLVEQLTPRRPRSRRRKIASVPAFTPDEMDKLVKNTPLKLLNQLPVPFKTPKKVPKFGQLPPGTKPRSLKQIGRSRIQT